MNVQAINDSSGDILRIMDGSNVDLVTVLSNPNIKAIFKKQNSKLNNYLFKNICNILDIAFGPWSNDCSASARSVSYFILTTPSPIFSSQLAMNQSFLDKLNYYLVNDDKMTVETINKFATIFDSLIKATNGVIFIKFPEKEKLFERLSKHINSLAVYNLMLSIIKNNLQIITSFLMECNVIQFFFQKLDDNSLFYNLIKAALPNSKFCSEIIKIIEIPEVSKKLFKKAIEDRNEYACDLLICICKILYEKNKSFILLKELNNNITKMIELIKEDENYGKLKDSILTLLNLKIKIIEHVDTWTIDLTDFLLNLFLKNKFNTSLHLRFLELFKNMFSLDGSIVEKIKIREKIMEIFKKRYTINASYWGILIEIAQIINDNDYAFNKVDNWNEFYENSIKPLQMIMDNPYGSPLPNEAVSDYSSTYEMEDDNNFEYEYDYEEEEEEEEFNPFHWSFASLIAQNKISVPLNIELVSSLRKRKEVEILRFSPDGKYLACSFDGTIEVLLVSNLTVVFSKSTNNMIIGIYFTSDSSKIICFNNTEFSIYKISDSSLSLRREIKKSNFVSLSSDFSKIALINNGITEIYEFPSMKLFSSFKKFQFEATYTTFSTDCKRVATGYEDGSVIIYSLESKTIINQIRLHKSQITSLNFDNDYLISASEESQLGIYFLENNILRKLQGHTSSIISVDYNHDEIIISGSIDNSINISLLKNCRMEYSLEAHSDSIINVTFCPNTSIFASSGMDRRVKIWEIKKALL